MRETEFGPSAQRRGQLLNPASILTHLRTRLSFGLALVLFALLIRVVAAVALEQFLVASGGDGFFALDDRSYDMVAWMQAQHWRGLGPPVPAGEQYLLNVYTYTEATLYLIVGHTPLAMKLLNCLFGALTAGLIYLMTWRLFSEVAARVSGIVAAIFPSTLLWSVTNLKDAMANFAVALTLWLLTELVLSARWRIVPFLLVALAVVGGLRSYVQLILGLIIPLAVAMQARLRFASKWRTTGALAAGCAVIVALNGQGLNFVSLERVNMQRFFAAQGAKSSFVPTPTVAVAAASPGGTGTTQGEGAAPGTRGPFIPPPADPVAGATSGDSGAAGRSSAPGTRSPFVPPPQPVITVGDEATTRQPLRSLATWLPTGLTYALAAPFPWEADRRVEQVTIPELLIWYVMVLLAVVGLVAHWREWRRFGHMVAYCGTMLLILASTQGNLGTLVRHRGMIIPFALVFSGAGAAWLWRRWSAARRPEHALARFGPGREAAKVPADQGD